MQNNTKEKFIKSINNETLKITLDTVGTRIHKRSGEVVFRESHVTYHIEYGDGDVAIVEIHGDMRDRITMDFYVNDEVLGQRNLSASEFINTGLGQKLQAMCLEVGKDLESLLISQ